MKANRTKLIVLGAVISLLTGFNAYLWNIICSTQMTFDTQMNNGDPAYILPLTIGFISVYIALFILIIISLILTAAVIFIIISLYKTSLDIKKEKPIISLYKTSLDIKKEKPSSLTYTLLASLIFVSSFIIFIGSNSVNYYLIFSLLAFQIILSLYMVINLYSTRVKSNKYFRRKL